MLSNTIKVGDVITYRGSWGTEAPKQAKVVGIEITEGPRQKYGIEVVEAPVSIVRENRVLFSLNDSHWCYGSQVVLP